MDKQELEMKKLALEIDLLVKKLEEEKSTSVFTTNKRKAELLKLESEARIEELKRKRAEKDSKIDDANSYDNGLFTFYEGVSDGSVRGMMSSLGEFSRHHVGKPIIVELNSPGGSVIAGFALYDFLQELRKKGHHLTIRCFGMAASMGGILLQAGDVREISKNSFVLIHEVASMSWGKLSDMKDDVEFSKALYDKCIDILASRAKLSAKKIKSLAERKDLWLDSSKCLEYGLVDTVLD